MEARVISVFVIRALGLGCTSHQGVVDQRSLCECLFTNQAMLKSELLIDTMKSLKSPS